MKIRTLRFSVAAIALGIFAPTARGLQSTDDETALRALAHWNTIALKTTAAGPFSPPRESRAMAMQSIAVFNAVNAITGRCEPFGARIAADRGASKSAAIAAASFHVLVSLYPRSTATLKASHDSAMMLIPAGPMRDAGVAAGMSAATAVLALRAQDRTLEWPLYREGTGAGIWVKTPPAYARALESGWGQVVPFVLDSGSQFRPPPPPRVGSEVYLRDYAEVVALGAERSATRTATQTETARFWMATAAPLWNQLVRTLSVEQEMEATAAARAYLVLNLAGADAFIAAWDAKYFYGQWRPVTAIRHAEGAGPSIPSDTTWSPLLATPPFPDYPAGHTAYAGAAEHVLVAVFGEKPGVLSITSHVNDVTHRYASFPEITDEVVNARVWAGVHWRTSSTAGTELGRAVGAHVMSRAPKMLATR